MWIKSKAKRYRYERIDGSWTRSLIWVEVDVWVGKRKFQKKPGQTKKQLTEKEVAKNDWREETKLKRDKAKPTWGQNGCKKFFKKYGWKRHRMHNKKCLKAGDYHKLHAKDYKFFVDPWDWD